MDPAKPLTKSGAGPTDAALVVAARAGDGWAQEALFRRYARMVVGLAHRVMPQDAEVDDLVQDAFLYAFERLDRLHNPQAFASWICSIVVRTAAKRLRRQRLLTRLGIRRAEPIDPDGIVSSAAPPDVALELRALYSLLGDMPAEERVALVLRRVETMEIAQIAEYMGLSASTVKRRLGVAESRLERARRR
jgi:RNA polymerase sigma-70 factor, ECF subfamily